MCVIIYHIYLYMCYFNFNLMILAICLLKKYKIYYQYQAISILRQSDKLSEKTKSIISTEMIENLYQAEWSRMSFLEKIGIDGSTIGRGQVSQIAYDDVIENFSEEIILYCDEVNTTLCHDFNEDIASPNIEDFIVTAYLSINIERRQKDGRTAEA